MAEKKKTTKKATTKKAETKKVIKETPKKVKVEKEIVEEPIKVEEPVIEEEKEKLVIDKVVDIVGVKKPEIKENVVFENKKDEMNTISAENVVKELNNRNTISFRRDFGYSWNGQQIDY